MEFQPTRRASEAFDALERALGRIRNRVADQLDGSGTTRQQLKILGILRDAGSTGMPTLTIARGLGEGSPGITRLVDRLERHGFVKRMRDGADRRQVRCAITSAGVAAVQAAEDAVRATVEEAFAALTHHEMAALVHLLRRVSSNA